MRDQDTMPTSFPPMFLQTLYPILDPLDTQGQWLRSCQRVRRRMRA